MKILIKARFRLHRLPLIELNFVNADRQEWESRWSNDGGCELGKS